MIHRPTQAEKDAVLKLVVPGAKLKVDYGKHNINTQVIHVSEHGISANSIGSTELNPATGLKHEHISSER